MSNWGDENTVDIQPAPLKRECHSCGRHEHLNRVNLCDACDAEWNAEMYAIDADEKEFDDREARGVFYGR